MPTRLTSVSKSLIRTRSLRDELVVQLQQEIITGVFAPGQRIVERELIERFGISSIPVREALQDLESRGLLVRRVNYGYSVVQLTYQDALRISEMRRVLEPRMMEWAAERITPSGVAEVERHLKVMEAAARGGDMAAFFHADLIFHRLLWEASGNAHAARALDTSLGSLFASGLAHSEAATRARTSNPIDRLAVVDQHRRMADAVKAGNGPLAANLLLEIAEGFERHFRPD